MIWNLIRLTNFQILGEEVHVLPEICHPLLLWELKSNQKSLAALISLKCEMQVED